MEKVNAMTEKQVKEFYDDCPDGYVGILEHHCRGVKNPYFVAWAGNPYTFKRWKNKVKTFDKEEEAMDFIVKNCKL